MFQDLRTRLSLTNLAAKPLEQFSSLISMYSLNFLELMLTKPSDRLEQPPPPPPHAQVPILNTPDVFPVYTLKSWQPPTRLQDLRFVR
jgi:hypothetical protein